MADILKDMTVVIESPDREVIKAFLKDEFFYNLKEYLETEDYALAKDAIKGLYALASQLALFNLYGYLLDLYEVLEYEEYSNAMSYYEVMIKEYEHLLEVYHD